MDIIKKIVYDYLDADFAISDKDLLTITSFRIEDDYGDKMEDFLTSIKIYNIKDLKEVVLNCRRAYEKAIM